MNTYDQVLELFYQGHRNNCTLFPEFASYIIENKGVKYWREIFEHFKNFYVGRMEREMNPTEENLSAIFHSSANDYMP